MTDINLSPYALLLVDIQKDFWPEKLATLYPDFSENVTNLLSLCRDNGIDIIHLRAKFKKDMSDWMPRYRIRKSIPCIEGTEGSEVLPFAVEKPDEKVFTKQTFDGFHNPLLINYLQKQQIRYLFIAGLVTSTCVLFTASSATQLGLLSAVISDCCADEPTIHSTILERYRFIFDTVRSDEIIECLPRWNVTMQDLAML